MKAFLLLIALLAFGLTSCQQKVSYVIAKITTTDQNQNNYNARYNDTLSQYLKKHLQGKRIEIITYEKRVVITGLSRSKDSQISLLSKDGSTYKGKLENDKITSYIKLDRATMELTVDIVVLDREVKDFYPIQFGDLIMKSPKLNYGKAICSLSKVDD